MQSENSFRSLNRETGMLEDTAEIRQVAVDLAHALQVVLANPVLGVLVPPPVLHDLIVYAVKALEKVELPESLENFLKGLARRDEQGG